MSDGPELVHLLVDGYVATVTLDSPTNRNALSRRLVEQLTTHLGAAHATPGVRLIVLTHTGGTFSAGADLVEAADEGMERGTRALLDLLRTVVGLPTPIVAVVRGHVRAGGVGLVGACDLALVTDESTFGFAEVRLGLAPAIISLTTRSRLADRVASRLYLTGEVFDGPAAAAYGLVSTSVAAESLDDAVAQLVRGFGQASPQGLRESKALLNAPLLARFAADGERLVALSARLFGSDEAKEGMRAFRERRPPSWTARS
ncbi:MAG: enoyl-CoA hydratase family protein [Nocardioidaceae bacterium]